MEKQSGGKIKVRMHELYADEVKKQPEEKKLPQIERKPNRNQKFVRKGQPEREKGAAGSFAVELVFSVLLLAAICALPTVQGYAHNVHLGTFSQMTNFTWLYVLGVSVGIFAVARIIIRKPYYACAFVSFGTFWFINFKLLSDFFRLFINLSGPAVIGGLVLYALLVAGFFFLLRLFYKKKLSVGTVTKIITVTFAGLVLFNVGLAFVNAGKTAAKEPDEEGSLVAVMPAAVIAAPVSSVEPTNTPDPADQTFGLPNIYFFILDEYGTFDIMEKYYGYDNKVFYDFLKSSGFNISRESYGTDNQTANCFADLLNLDYISKKLSKNERSNAIQNAGLFSILKELGYTQYQIANSTYFKGIPSLIKGIAEEDNDEEEKDVNLFGDQAAADVFDTSITSALAELLGQDNSKNVDTEALNQWGYYPSEYVRNSKAYKTYKERKNMSRADATLRIFDYLESTDIYTKSKPYVVYGYMLPTHVPFVFDEYGGILPYSQNRNWEDRNIYLNQYKYANKRLIVSLSTIIANDPNSIIILMSDHGIRYHSDCTKKHTFYITNKDSCRILNAVYIKGEEHDIEGLSGINTLRYVLSLYEGQDYPPIKDPITSDSPDNLKGIIPKPR